MASLPEILPNDLALDLRSPEYQFLQNPKARTALAMDIAYYVGDLSEAVNPLRWQVDEQGKVIDILRGGRDVREQFGYKDSLQRSESGAGQLIVDALLNKPDGTLCVWISPSGGPRNYLRARLTVGLVNKKSGISELEGYGIDAKFDPTECLYSGKLLASLVPRGFDPLDAENLRGHTFILDRGVYGVKSPWKFLEEIFPFPAWENVQSQKAQEQIEERLVRAELIADKVLPKIQGAKTSLEILRVGINADETIEKSFNVRVGTGGCGSSYKESAFKLLFTTVESDGTIKSKTETEGKFVKNCGSCGIMINKVISKGYVCRACGGVYEGC